MKAIFRIALIAFIVSASNLTSVASTFGFKGGMTPEQVTAAVGKDAVKSSDIERGELNMILTTVPEPDPVFSSYSLIFSNKGGLVKVYGFSGDIPMAVLPDAFKNVQVKLIQEYSKSSSDSNKLDSEDPDDRALDSYWTNGEGGVKLPAGLAEVALSASLNSETFDREESEQTGTVRITYVFAVSAQ